jgi:asparagine synthase (glutamine-hydrolysing)
MCGIAGFFLNSQVDSHNTSEENLIKMLSKITHRGPDNLNYWSDIKLRVYLGHTRLSILDLSEKANQPMISSSQRYVITFNGEIYNFETLKKKYLQKNNTLNSSSDTEVLIELIDSLGFQKTLSLLKGMFAFSVLDRKEKKLFLARDRLGEKPLYYYFDRNIFIFGSEIKALLPNKNFKKQINIQNLDSYFKYGYFTGSKSIFQNLHKIKPGQFLELCLNHNEIHIEKYWDYSASTEKKFNRQNSNLLETSKELETKLIDTINSQRLADVPVGAFLSGGIDSSLIVSILSQISEKKVKTFTIGFDDKRLDESNYAAKISNYLKTEHIELKLNNYQLLDTVENLTTIYDEPFSDSSQIPTVLLSKLAKENVKVALSGDGGDELFGGYSRYLWSFKIKNFNPLLKFILSKIVTNIEDSTMETVYNYLKILLPASYQFKMPIDKLKKIEKIISLKNIDKIYDRLMSIWFEEDNLIPNLNSITSNPDKKILNQADMMNQDIETYLPDDLLVKIDRASMSTSLETRTPFLDHEIVEYAANIPINYKIKKNNQKIILKKILSKYLPTKLYERPKMGFEVPIDDWLRGPLKDYTYDSINSLKLKSPVDLNFDIIDKKISEHMNGKNNWHYQIWNIILFQKWCDQYL